MSAAHESLRSVYGIGGLLGRREAGVTPRQDEGRVNWVGLSALEPRLLLGAGATDPPGVLVLAGADDPAVVLELTDPTGLLATSSGALAKISTSLALTFAEHQRSSSPDLAASDDFIQVADGLVVIDAVAAGQVDVLLSDLESLGLVDGATYGSYVSGRLPVEAVADMAALDSLQSASAAMSPWTNGRKGRRKSVISQGDDAMRADVARAEFDVDGSGVKVGVASDSFDYLGGAAEDIANGELPAWEGAIEILAPVPSGTTAMDEGRALMQLIHDVAPGASMAFHTVYGGQAAMAAGILALADAGADIIVDDAIYLAEPMFQDGPVAVAVDEVVADGVSYFSSAGNNDRLGYESPYRASGVSLMVNGLPAGELHNFDPDGGNDYLQEITVPVGDAIIVVFQWDSPFDTVDAPMADIDLYLTDPAGEVILRWSRGKNIVSRQPVELFGFRNQDPENTKYNMAISHVEGTAPGLMKYVVYTEQDGVLISEYDTASGTVYGHANAAGAEAVGAAFYNDTPEYGQDPPVLETYSSAGPTPILFAPDGVPQAREIRQHPDIIAPDGVNTSFFGQDIEQDRDKFPNFFGTSAAAPHAAAVAALMLEFNASLTPDQVYTILEETALDMAAPGVDYDTGYGLVQADMALLAMTPPALSAGVVGEDVTLTWTDTIIGESGFQIERALKTKGKKGGEPVFSVIATVGPGQTTYTDESPGKGSWLYRLRVVGVPYVLDAGDAVKVTVSVKKGGKPRKGAEHDFDDDDLFEFDGDDDSDDDDGDDGRRRR